MTKKVTKVKPKTIQAKPSPKDKQQQQQPDSNPAVINLGGGRTAQINMYDNDGKKLPQLMVRDVPATSVDLIAVKLEELGYQLAGSQQSQKFDLGFQLGAK